MRNPLVLLSALSAISILTTACGQVGSGRSLASTGGAPDLSYVYTAPGSTPSTGGNVGSVVSGSTSGSSAAPQYATGAANGGTYTLGLGTSTTFVAPFVTNTSLTYKWYKNGSAISGATSSEYTLSSVAATDYGSYTVTAANANGTLTSSAFIIQPILMLATLGSHDCNGAQCNNDPTTAAEVCQLRYGTQSVMANPYSFGPSGTKWTTSFCTWTSSGWSCNSNCTWSCSGYNVLGYVYCLQ